MTDYKGRDFLLKLGTASSGTVIADCRTHSLKVNNEQVDITNKSSNGYRTYLEGAGVKSLTVTFGGLVSNDTGFETLQGYAFSNSINAMGIAGLGDGDTIDANWAITSLELTGEYNGAQAFTTTIESTGTYTLTAV